MSHDCGFVFKISAKWWKGFSTHYIETSPDVGTTVMTIRGTVESKEVFSIYFFHALARTIHWIPGQGKAPSYSSIPLSPAHNH